MPSTISAGTTAGTAIAFAGDTTGNLAFQTNGTTTAMTIDTSQNVGIGTSSPSTLLHTYTSAQESIRFARNSTSSSAYVTFYANNSSSTQVQYAGILGDVASSTAGSHGGNLLFYTTGSGTSAERMRIDSSGNLLFNSGYGSVATAYGCRAWVVFNGTGTPSVRASGNISSITDNGTGDYTANFTTAMPDINYSVGGNSAGTLNSDGCSVTGLGGATNYRSTSSLRFLFFYNPGNATTDRDYINLQIFR